MTQQNLHPSLLFQNGVVHDFHTAMQLYISQQEFENKEGRRLGATHSQMEQMRESLREVIAATKQAEEIYESIVTPALKAAAEKMRSTGNPSLQEFANALETGNYEGLAL